MQITTIGLDIAKNVFQVHGIDAAEKVVVRKQLRRGQVLKFFAALPPCLVGMEACATDPEAPESANYFRLLWYCGNHAPRYSDSAMTVSFGITALRAAS